MKKTIVLLALAGLVMPLAAAGVLAWGWSDRAGSLDHIPVAIVNDDEIVTGTQPMAAGRALSAALVHPAQGKTSLDWTLTTAPEAATGLERGTYYAVLTIPKDFSHDVLSTAGTSPTRAELTLRTNPAASETAAIASQAVAQTAAATLGTQITSTYLTNVYAGLDQVSTSLASAAAGAASLDQGAASLADGTARVGEGAGSLSSGAAKVAGGAASLDQAAASLAGSTNAVAGGVSQLSTGATGLSHSLAQLSASCTPSGAAPSFCASLAQAAASSSTLAGSAVSATSGAAAVASGAQQLHGAATQVASGADAVSSSAKRLASGATSAAHGAASLASASGDLADGLQKGAAEAPDYTKEQSASLSSIVSDPVGLATTAATSSGGWGSAGIAAIVLWLGALAGVVLGRRGVRSADLAAPVRTGRLLRVIVAPRLGLAVLQGIVTTVAVGVFGGTLQQAIGFGALSVLAAVAFSAILTGASLVAPRAAAVVFVVLSAVQIAAIGGIVPVETAPAFLQGVSPYLPLVAYLDGAAQLAGGGSVSSIAVVVAVLAAWALGALLLGFLALRRRRMSPTPTSRATWADGGGRTAA